MEYGPDAVLLTVGPPGIDTPAHLFMTWLFRHAGVQLWNNYWYGGNEVLGYSVLFPPLAILVIGALAWLLAGGRRRTGEKYAGLRILR